MCASLKKQTLIGKLSVFNNFGVCCFYVFVTQKDCLEIGKKFIHF
jgi:hypothetical protein